MKLRKIFILSLLGLCLLGCENKETVEESFALKYQNQTFTLGEVFSKEKYGEELSYSEVSSCAFEGLDKTYRYSDFEVTTYPIDGEEKVAVIYFLDENIETTEGLKISDSLQKMLDLYGTDYQKEDTMYQYQKGNTLLKFIVSNDTVISIEYVLEI